MRALLYLEARYLRHQAAAIVRSPLRLLIWIPYACSIAYLVFARATRSHGSGSLATSLPAHVATGVGGMYLGMLGLTVSIAAFGRIAAFRSPGEAVLFANAGIPPITMAIWLQIRRLALSSGRYLGSLVYVFLIFSPRHVGFAIAARGAVGAVLAIALQLATDLPIFLLARGPARWVLRATGFALVAGGFGFAALAFFAGSYVEPTVRRLGLDPGRVVLAIVGGDVRPIEVFVAILIASTLAVRFLGNDALPELYAASQTPLALGRRRVRPEHGVRFERPATTAIVRVPPGAFAVVWKDWVGFKRGRAVVWLWLGGCAFWTACGALVGTLDARFHDPTLLVTLFGATGLLLLFGTPSGAAAVIANDLGKPLFWLSRAPLRARIVAWTFARTWRGATAIALAPIVATVLVGNVSMTLLALPVVFASYWALQALGVGLYAIFPDPIDTRGPMVFVRLFATVLFTVPAVVVALIAGALGGGATLAVVLGAAAFAAEGWAVVELASLHFREHGAAFATLAKST